ncbi:MAG: hypothetical protein O2960_02970 [Verrucomicrobia bacterium]|nr:hypothetical protein [Verrucomicrobiota bacterium]
MWKNLLAAISLCIAASLEAWALISLTRDGNSIPNLDVFVMHAIGVAFGMAAFQLWWPRCLRTSRIGFSLLYLGLCAPLPLAGLALVSLFRLILLIKPSRLQKSDYVLGERPFLTLERIDELELQTPHSVLEILSGKNQSLRRIAILALRSVDPKKALPLLQKAIQDSDEQVRLLAQTQFNKILARLETAVKLMEADLADHPGSPNRIVVLAEHYHELVYLAVSSQETESIYLERAIHLLNEALALEPKSTTAHFLLLKCQVKIKNLDAAKASVRTLRSLGFPQDSLAPWVAEISFQDRDWRTLKQDLESIRISPSHDPRLDGLIEFWLHPEHPGKEPV